jgi:hypothetical protein
MKPFGSAAEMLVAHELMFGAAGRKCAEFVLRWAPRLFAVPLDPLHMRVVLAPAELSPYNRQTGYHCGDGVTTFILANRHHCDFSSPTEIRIIDIGRFEDFIIHELTHARQAQLMWQNGWSFGSRGVHRDLGWYTAVAEACPNYLGVQLPRSSWPTGPRTRKGTLTEADMTYWPGSLRTLARRGDARFLPMDSAEAA